MRKVAFKPCPNGVGKPIAPELVCTSRLTKGPWQTDTFWGDGHASQPVPRLLRPDTPRVRHGEQEKKLFVQAKSAGTLGSKGPLTGSNARDVSRYTEGPRAYQLIKKYFGKSLGISTLIWTNQMWLT